MVDRTQDTYRNPISLAIEWQEALSTGKYATQSALAKDVGVHPASVSNMLSLLKLHPDVIRVVLFLGDPLPGPLITVDRLTRLRRLPMEQQKTVLRDHLRIKGITVLNL